jgi:hypothetical protein
VGVATVEDLAEQVGEQLDELRRDVLVAAAAKSSIEIGTYRSSLPVA